MQTDTKIIVIDDNLKKNAPLMVELIDKYGINNILLFNRSSEGLDFILQNLFQRMVIILDWDLGHGELQGIEIFDNIRAKTSLAFIIFNTVKEIDDIPRKQLKKIDRKSVV